MSEPDRTVFVTLDDLLHKAEELFTGLQQLGEYRHPLDIRRGIGVRKEVKPMTDKEERSRMLKAGSKTYFFDLKETKEGKPYLAITESRITGDNKERATLIIFPEQAGDFARIVSEMTSKLS